MRPPGHAHVREAMLLHLPARAGGSRLIFALETVYQLVRRNPPRGGDQR